MRNTWARRARPRSLLGIVVLTAAACAGEAADPLSPVVTDSAGISVVTYELAEVAVPVLASLGEHDLQLGVQNGALEYTFSRIPDLGVAPNGSLVVSDALAQEFRVYDPAGGFLGRIGQAGEGPGEFASAPLLAGISHDTVFALDTRSSRLTTFTLDGAVLSTARLGGETLGRPVLMIRQEDGSFLAQSPWVPATPDRSVHDMRLELDSMVVERLDPSGVPLDTVLVLPDRTRARHSVEAGGGLIRTRAAAPPFATRAFLRSDGRGSVIGHNDSFELQLRGPEGQLQRMLRVLGVQNPMTGAEMRRRQEASLLERFGEDVDPLLRRLNVEFIPDRLQAFQTILVAANGDIWVALTEFDGSDGYDWLVFDSRGELRGSVRTPPRLSVFEVHDDYVVGVFLDDLDVSYVRRYPLGVER